MEKKPNEQIGDKGALVNLKEREFIDEDAAADARRMDRAAEEFDWEDGENFRGFIEGMKVAKSPQGHERKRN